MTSDGAGGQRRHPHLQPPPPGRAGGGERAFSADLRDLELLVVDGGRRRHRREYSWDGTPGSATSGGGDTEASSARNAGIRLARAPTVAFLDADNRWLPDHLEVVVACSGAARRRCWRAPARVPPPARRSLDARLIDPLPGALVEQDRLHLRSRRAARRPARGRRPRRAWLVGEDDDLWLRLASGGRSPSAPRHTIIRRHTRGGLRDKGRRSGGYTEANTLTLSGRSSELATDIRSPQGGAAGARPGTAPRSGRGGAIERGDARGAAELAQACALVPEIEHNPGILSQLWKSAHVAAELQQRMEAAAAAMPDPSCFTALYFRAYAAVMCHDEGSAVEGRPAGTPPSASLPGGTSCPRPNARGPQMGRPVPRSVHSRRDR